MDKDHPKVCKEDYVLSIKYPHSNSLIQKRCYRKKRMNTRKLSSRGFKHIENIIWASDSMLIYRKRKQRSPPKSFCSNESFVLGNLQVAFFNESKGILQIHIKNILVRILSISTGTLISTLSMPSTWEMPCKDSKINFCSSYKTQSLEQWFHSCYACIQRKRSLRSYW